MSLVMIYWPTVTHPSTNRAQCRATTLIKTSALPLSEAGLTDNVRRWRFELYECFLVLVVVVV